MVTHAKAYGPPDNWGKLKIFKGDEQLFDVLEVNVLECWAVRLAKDGEGHLMIDPHGNHVICYKDRGNFRIVEPEDGEEEVKNSKL